MKKQIFTFFLALVASAGIASAAITVRLDPSSCPSWSTVRLWAWTDAGNVFDSWPGQIVSMDDDGWYSYSFDEDITSVSIIWNNGGTYQTVDIEGVTSSTCYALNSTSGKAITVSVVNCSSGSSQGGTPVSGEYKIGDLYYNLDASNQTAEVDRNSSASGEIIIPSSVTYNSVTYSVTSIGYGAFYYCRSLTSVTIPNSVTSIGDQAFASCTGLTSVTIGNSVTSIGDLAFEDCTGLTSVTIPNSVTSIGDWAFEDCTGLTSVTIGNSVTNIGNSAFSWCSGLTSVTIPNSVTSIGDQAFASCTGLTSVTIGNSVTSIGYGVFLGCTGLTSPVYNAHVFAFMPTSYSGAYTIPDGIETIAAYAFRDCSSLTSVTIPNSVTSIGDQAFEDCSGLTSVTIGNSVTSIGTQAFKGCTGLTSPVYNAHVFAFMPTSYSGAYTIPDGIEYIAGYAFYGCSGLTSVTIPNSVTSIGDRAFYFCIGLTSVTIPNSVTSIGSEAFYGVLNIVYKGTATGSSWGAWYFNCYVDGYLVYSDDTKTKLLRCYTSAAEEITIPNSVTSIGQEAFRDCSGLTSVTIPNSVTSIGDHAFYNCSGLTSVTIGNSVTSIGEYAFYGCSNLKNVIIGSSVKVLEQGAFSGCSSIESITCYSQRPPTVNQNALYGLNFSTIVYVPADYLNNYVIHDAWGLYDVRPLGAKSTETTDVNVTPAENTAEVAWPAVSGAATYELVIKDKSGNVICTLIFNAQGQLTQIVFNAPSRDQATQQTQAAGFSFTVTGLENGTSYDLTITSKDNNGGTLDTKTVSFTTIGEPQGIEDVLSDDVPCTKVIRDGQIFIFRGEKEYTVTGQELK